MRKVRLTFAPQYVEPILSGGKRATIRYGLDRAIEAGDALHLTDPSGEHFGTAHVTRVWQGTAWDVAATDIDGHRAYRDVFDLLEHLRGFYDDPLTPNTDLTVVEWDGTHRAGSCENHHGLCDACLGGEPSARWSA